MTTQYIKNAIEKYEHRIEWALKMAIGMLCYWPVLWWPLCFATRPSKTYMWALGHAGFYAYDNGFAEWIYRVNQSNEH